MSYYIYLISSLPMLHFTAKPPFSFEKFLEVCQRFIPEEGMAVIKIAAEKPGYVYTNEQPTYKKWFAFDTALRNELVKIRASHKKIEPDKYLRKDSFSGPSIAHIAIGAHRNPSIVDAERMLDQERWHILEELSLGHYFDIDFLIIYGLKLLLLERWERIDSADKPRLLEETLKRG